MSKVASQSSQSTTMVKVPHEKIAMRAYEKWCQRGRPHGSDMKDWVDAEKELQAEMARSGGSKR